MNSPNTINQAARNFGKTAAISQAQRMEEAEQHQVRLLTMVDLPGYYATSDGDTALPEEVDAFVDDCWKVPKRHESVNQIMVAFEEFEDDQIEALYVLQGDQLKLLFKFECTVKNYFNANAFSASWGHVRTAWFAADTYDEAWKLAVEWAQEVNAKDLAKREGAHYTQPLSNLYFDGTQIHLNLGPEEDSDAVPGSTAPIASRIASLHTDVLFDRSEFTATGHAMAAAGEMLSALQAVASKLGSRPYGTGSYLPKSIRDQVFAAIARATGQEGGAA